jgi:hypothetical protein
MKYRTPLAVLSVLVIWLAASLVRVENQRYALSIGMCRDQATGLTNFTCLEKTETRTNWIAHLMYGLGVL